MCVNSFLGKKLVSIFTLSKQLLSQQQHYDWGLRALKTVLSVGGQLVQAAKKSSKQVIITRKGAVQCN